MPMLELVDKACFPRIGAGSGLALMTNLHVRLIKPAQMALGALPSVRVCYCGSARRASSKRMKNFGTHSVKLSGLGQPIRETAMGGSTTQDVLLRVIDQIYSSIERPELWPDTIFAIGEFIGGRRDFWTAAEPLLGHSDNVGQRTLDAMSTGCNGTFLLSRADLRVLDEYTEQLGKLIVRFLKIVFMSMLWSQKDVGAREVIGLRMTRRYLQAFDVSGTASAVPSKSGARNFVAALWEDGRLFTGDHLQSMRLLAPHLDRALRLQMRLSATELQTNTVSGVLDRLTLGVILVDRAGQPAWQNRRAKEIVAHSDVLHLSSAGLTGRTPADTRALRELIKGAVSAGTQGVLALPRGETLRPLLLTAISLRPDAVGDPADQFALGVVFISDPERVDNPTIDSLRRAFDLTHREAEMTIAIAHGHGLRAAAAKMGVAVTTARSQLQQAFMKTGTKHQAELAALVRTLTHLRQD
jgi:DNA-binding CsgD family transcriptional regulator